MRKFSLSFFLVCVLATSFCQTVETVALADSLIQPGTFKIAITTYKFPAAIEELQRRAVANLKKDPRWSDRYIITLVEKGDRYYLKFMEAYGLTKGEFTTMLNGFKRGMDPVLSDTGTVVIKKQKGIISFTTTGKFSLLKYLKINTNSHIISLDNLVLSKERKTTGEYYTPTLNGLQAFGSAGTVSPGLQKNFSYFSLLVGVNDRDTRTCLSLGYGRGSSLNNPPDFLVVTIF